MRKCGTLLHISSLPSEYGIGDFGPCAYDFVDFLKISGQSLWQILPLGITGYGDSPYQSFSSFALNPYFISPEILCEEGYITKSELISERVPVEAVNYGLLYLNRYRLLRRAVERFDLNDPEYEEFYIKNAWWLDSFSWFMTVKSYSDFVGLTEWRKELKRFGANEVSEIVQSKKDEVYFWRVTQFWLFKQWNRLKDYANKNSIGIIGDIPIYVASDSADVWENPGLFMVDNDLSPKLLAGCPPDAFNKNGQLWGNPIYDWEAMRLDGYSWWKKRFAMNSKMYDFIRIDHFRGFSGYYAIDAADADAKCGRWYDGPGIDFFKEVESSIGTAGIIAEDLGFIDGKVRRLLADTGFPGMKILEFGFDSNTDSEYLPHNYEKNTFAYLGTHDNMTFMSYYLKSDIKMKVFIKNYLNCTNSADICFSAIRALYSSYADNVIISMQDYVGLGDEARINVPSTIGNNWRWRATKSQFNDEIAHRIKELASLYGRTHTEEEDNELR